MDSRKNARNELFKLVFEVCFQDHSEVLYDEFLENETNPKEAETSSTQDDAVGGMSAGNQDLFIKSLWFAINSKMVSISQLQRRFQIGYNRAGAIVDRMERMGYVSPNEGSKARRVLITREQMEEKYGPETSDYLD